MLTVKSVDASRVSAPSQVIPSQPPGELDLEKPTRTVNSVGWLSFLIKF